MSLKAACASSFVKELLLRLYTDNDFFLPNINKPVVLKFLEENTLVYRSKQVFREKKKKEEKKTSNRKSYHKITNEIV